MAESDDYQPFLQIIHVTDMHFVDPRHTEVVGDYRLLKRLAPEAATDWADEGTAPHDILAPAAFTKFLRELTKTDTVWSGLPTWLIDTGDASGYGDDASLETAHERLQLFAEAAGNAKLKFIYGNHDAWPAKFPALAGFGEIEAHRKHLRSKWYPATEPDVPLRVTIPGTVSEVQLWCLNSVVHERVKSVLALGEIQRDRYWEGDASGSRAAGNAVQDLADRITAEPGARHFRILAIHHPLHYPQPAPRLQMVMVNSGAVADDLERLGAPDHVPLAHLILSGHTHQLFPALGALPQQPADCRHEPLKHSQCQLIGASLSQRGPDGDPWPQQAQILRFYHSRDEPRLVLVERLVAARANGVGPFGFVAESDGSPPGEEMFFSF